MFSLCDRWFWIEELSVSPVRKKILHKLALQSDHQGRVYYSFTDISRACELSFAELEEHLSALNMQFLVLDPLQNERTDKRFLQIIFK